MPDNLPWRKKKGVKLYNWHHCSLARLRQQQHIIGHYNSEIGINSSLETLIFAPESWPSILHINPVGKNLVVEVLMFRDLPFLLTEVTSGSRRIGNQIIQFPRSNENLKTAQINQIKDSRRSISSEVTSTREPYKCLETPGFV